MISTTDAVKRPGRSGGGFGLDFGRDANPRSRFGETPDPEEGDRTGGLSCNKRLPTLVEHSVAGLDQLDA
ncbi:MAG: hypothetical protein U5O39_03855 [Gammaproteobacteria bacterium]|nr:hypothetical protein [Gammaproteobacteria bacterium]